MSDNWDSYFCRVDDKPGSIFLDLDIAGDAPLVGYAHVAYVRLRMRNPRPDGLSSQDEFEILKQIEDRLNASLTAAGAAAYVGRTTSDGSRDYYFYLRVAGAWDARVALAMKPFPDYRYETATRADPQWETYFEFLYPSPEDMQRIQNRRVCESLRENGDTLTEEREIDQTAYFPNDAARAKFIARALDLGFKVRRERAPEEAGAGYGVQVYSVDLPSFENIDQITLPLHRVANEVGGSYDGWESEVVW
jgi:Family of unknown function (DUF695)/Regulator of ribonuclease activity B